MVSFTTALTFFTATFIVQGYPLGSSDIDNTASISRSNTEINLLTARSGCVADAAWKKLSQIEQAKNAPCGDGGKSGDVRHNDNMSGFASKHH